MSDSFTDLVFSVHRQLGGRATAHDVAVHVASILDGEAYRELTQKGFESIVRAALRQRDADTGLPQAPCIDGEYVQAELLSSDELRQLARDSHRRGREAIARAEAYAERHLTVYGVAIDPATGEDLDEATAS